MHLLDLPGYWQFSERKFGRIWAQNPAQLRCDPSIILTCHLRVGTEGDIRIAVAQPLLSHLDGCSQPVHQAAVSVPEGMESAVRVIRIQPLPAY